MTRPTIETVRDTIATLRDQETVYKVEVDNLKHAFNRAFEADWSTVKDTKHLSVDRGDRTKFDDDLYFAAPHEVRHWYGKKFSDFLEGLPSSEFKDATVSHRNRWRPLFLALQDLIARQTKGRRPAESKTVIGTRTQFRATCPCCFKDHAVRGENMVAHGYTLDYGFHNGSCLGEGRPHFGTTAGVTFTQELIRNIRNTAATLRRKVEGAKMGEVKPVDKAFKRIDNPTERQIADLIYRLEGDARNADDHAKQLQNKVDDWKLCDPREVEVEITE